MLAFTLFNEAVYLSVLLAVLDQILSDPVLIFLAVIAIFATSLVMVFLFWNPLTKMFGFSSKKAGCKKKLEDLKVIDLLNRLANGPEPTASYARADLQAIKKIDWSKILDQRELVHIEKIVDDIEFWQDEERKNGGGK